MSTPELLSRQAAAERLAQQLPDKNAEQWALFLRNNANTARQAFYRLPVERIGRSSFYREGELSKFIEFEKARQIGTLKLSGRAAQALQAFGIGQKGGSTKGRQWKGGSANLINEGESITVQAIINEPLTVFVMTPAEAIEFGRDLIETGQAAQRISGQRG
ncbi:MAG TPA: hypothetical protein PK205_16505 [Promineifilum sp.]|uniref:hypothetical protein n=1 Tax=Thauera sp. TaxID=1905334 RepID=UPI002BBFFA3E|nr:hypothetical protein [Thauera sp.]HRP25450.1 hypothetical protein [Thauera sp.]HRQ14906.1 hypothetical protein [Promineifilum sp.]